MPEIQRSTSGADAGASREVRKRLAERSRPDEGKPVRRMFDMRAHKQRFATLRPRRLVLAGEYDGHGNMRIKVY